MKLINVAVVLAVLLVGTSAAWGQESGGPIHQSLGKHLKNAAKGEPVGFDNFKQDIRDTVIAEIDQIVERAEKLRGEDFVDWIKVSKEELTDGLEKALIHELTGVDFPKKEVAQLRALLVHLDLRVEHDYTLSTGAIPAEQTSVRIRLPELHACQGCKKILEKALNETEGFQNAVVNVKTCTAQFIADAGMEVEVTINNLEKANVKQLAEWELVRKY